MAGRARGALVCWAVAIVLAMGALAAPAWGAGGPGRGSLVSATALGDLSAAGVRGAIAESHIAGGQAVEPVAAYRLVYRTIGIAGEPTRASGLLVLPRDGRADLRTIAFEHGTTAARAEAPSTGADSYARQIALLDASAGFAAVAPDYLGLGVGPGPQAYLQVRTEASASLDMLRAAREFAARLGRHLDPRILVSGFSQGGQAAMGLGRALQEGAGGRISLGWLAAISGPYDLQGAELPAILDGRTAQPITNFNLAIFALSWQRLYGIGDSRGGAFRPTADRLLGLFDGEHAEPQIFGALPKSLKGPFRPAFLRSLRHPHGALLRALRENDSTCSWRPRVPVRLYFSPADEAVAPADTAHCAARLRRRGASVRAIPVGRVEHLVSAAVAAPLVLGWFEADVR